MRCLIVAEYWSSSQAWLIAGLQLLNEKELEGWTFTCTDPRWFRGNADELLKSTCEAVEFTHLVTAYTQLSRNSFDAVLTGETSEVLWVLPGFAVKPNVILLEASDLSYLSYHHVTNPCLSRILKSQYPSFPLWVGDRFELTSLRPELENKVVPWPYFGANPQEFDTPPWTDPDDGKLFFSGWWAPAVRPRCIDKLLRAGVPFTGGLHQREEHSTINVESGDYHPATFAPRVGRRAWLEEVSRCGAALDLPGNGQLTHRFVEAMMLGCPVIALRREIRYAGRAPTDDEVAWCSEDDLVDEALRLLADRERRRQLGAAGRAYYEKFLSPRAHALRFIEVLNETVGEVR